VARILARLGGHDAVERVGILNAVSHPERIVPTDTEAGIVALHMKRYEFAAPLCAGLEVLDAACGVGYGTALLAQSAAHVVGVDRDIAAIEYADRMYDRANVQFAVMDVLELDLPDASFEAVCSFETIEHLAEPEVFLGQVRRVLKPGGLLVASTPRVDVTTHEPANPFHELELSEQDFEALLRRHFAEVEIYGQRRLQTAAHRALQHADVFGLRRRLPFLRRLARLVGTAPTADLTADDIVISKNEIERATELIAVCRAG
jgi:2-polyprenyl-3-methyl-5-hydroxy-6-metoxy-1,4-benzoquinol methylase